MTGAGLEEARGFTGTYDGFRGWVTTIARHRALDHLRRHQRKPPAIAIAAEDLATWPAHDDTAQHALDDAATRDAIPLIATLPPDQAEAVLLRAVLGLDATTAGEVLGKRSGAIRTAASRGLRTLSRKLESGKRSSRVMGVLAKFPLGDVALDLVALAGRNERRSYFHKPT